MDFYDWMLALHLLAAFAVAAALVLYSMLVVSGRRMATLEQTRTLFRVAPIGTPLIGGGAVLLLVFGVILAIDSDTFELWDGWVIAGIVLWALFGAVGQRTGVYYTNVQKLAESADAGVEAEVLARLRAPTGATLHLATVVIFVLAVLDMIFKPGSVTMFAAIRPDDIDLAVFVHVAGAMVLVGGLITAAAAAIVGWRDETAALRRFSYWALLAVALPGWIVMRVGAGWAASKEHLDDLPEDPTWLSIGFITAELGGLLLLIALILGGIGLRRERSGRGSGLLKASAVIATVLVAAYVVAVWAMGAKPS